jgi:hypothetical protein
VAQAHHSSRGAAQLSASMGPERWGHVGGASLTTHAAGSSTRASASIKASPS